MKSAAATGSFLACYAVIDRANATPVRITPPVIVDGRIDRPGDIDYFVFSAKKDDKLVMQVQARRLGSPMDSVLTLYDA